MALFIRITQNDLIIYICQASFKAFLETVHFTVILHIYKVNCSKLTLLPSSTARTGSFITAIFGFIRLSLCQQYYAIRFKLLFLGIATSTNPFYVNNWQKSPFGTEVEDISAIKVLAWEELEPKTCCMEVWHSNDFKLCLQVATWEDRCVHVSVGYQDAQLLSEVLELMIY